MTDISVDINQIGTDRVAGALHRLHTEEDFGIQEMVSVKDAIDSNEQLLDQVVSAGLEVREFIGRMLAEQGLLDRLPPFLAGKMIEEEALKVDFAAIFVVAYRLGREDGENSAQFHSIIEGLDLNTEEDSQ